MQLPDVYSGFSAQFCFVRSGDFPLEWKINTILMRLPTAASWRVWWDLRNEVGGPTSKLGTVCWIEAVFGK